MTAAISRRERKKQETRERILDAALTRFQTHGFDDTSVDEIAQAADVSRGTFFNYFPTKESVLHEIARSEIADLLRRSQVEGAATPTAQIRQVMRSLVRDTQDFMRVTRYVLLQTLQHPTADRTFDLDLAEILEGLVRSAQSCGEIRAELDPAHVARAIVGAYLSALFAWVAVEGNISPVGTPLVESIVEMLFDGISGPRYPGRGG